MTTGTGASAGRCFSRHSQHRPPQDSKDGPFVCLCSRGEVSSCSVPHKRFQPTGLPGEWEQLFHLCLGFSNQKLKALLSACDLEPTTTSRREHLRVTTSHHAFLLDRGFPDSDLWPHLGLQFLVLNVKIKMILQTKKVFKNCNP